MIEFFKGLLKPLLEILLIIPMPWRALMILLGSIYFSPWVFLRAFPWLLAKLSQALLFFVEIFAKYLLVPGILIAQRQRINNQNIPQILLFFDALIRGLVGLFYEINQKLTQLLEYTRSKQWLPDVKWLMMVGLVIPLAWYTRPIFGDTAVAKFIDSSATWWYSLEGWVINDKWISPVATSSPEIFIKDYFSLLNSGNYSKAWGYLSPKFQGNQRLMLDGYNSYLKWWRDEVERVEFNQINIVSRSIDSATVDVKLKYLMRGNQDLSSPEAIELFLVWDARAGRWSINGAKKL